MTRSLEIKIEIALDKNNVKYFPGDTIEGKIFLTSNQNCSLHEFRLGWSGRILVQPVSTNKDARIYFDECWRLGPNLVKSKSKTPMGNSNVHLYHTELVLASNIYEPEPKLKLPKNKPIALSFSVQVPNDRPLPSCTEFNVSSNKIIYCLEAYILDQDTKFFAAQKQVPVYEAIYTRTEEKLRPIRVEQAFTVSAAHREFPTAIRVTLPCQSCQAGIAIPASITIWNEMEFVRRQGISVSLFRVNQVLSNGRAYTSQGEKINRVIADLEVTSHDYQSNQKMQTVRVSLPVPKGTTPTVTFEQSQLLSISYFVRVQVLAQDGVYTTPDGKKSQFMIVDIPFSIGTLSTPNGNSSSSSPVTTPLSSPTQTFGSISNMFSSPSYQTMLQQPFDFASSGISETSLHANTSPISSPITPKTSPLPVSQKTTSSATTSPKTYSSPTLSRLQPSPTSPNSTLLPNEESKRNSLSGIFRKSSTGSTSTQSSEKKKGFFSNLKLYSRQGKQQQQEEEQSSELSQTESPELPPLLPPRPAELTQTSTAKPTEQRGVFDIFADDSLTDDEEDAPPVSKPSPPILVSPPVDQTVFQMFPDDDSDSDDDIVQSLDIKENQPPAKQEQAVVGAPNRSQKVFQMFEDSDSDDDSLDETEVHADESVVGKTVKPDSREQPHQSHESEAGFYKPDTANDSSSDDENPSESDLLAALAHNNRS